MASKSAIHERIAHARHTAVTRSRPESGLSLLNRAVFVGSSSPILHFQRASLLDLLSDASAAAASYAVARALAESDPALAPLAQAAREREAQIRFSEGVRLLRSRAPSPALVWLDAASELAPAHVGLALHRCVALVALGRLASALEILDSVVGGLPSAPLGEPGESAGESAGARPNRPNRPDRAADAAGRVDGDAFEVRLAGLALRATLLQANGRPHDAHTDVIALLRLSPQHRVGNALARKWDAIKASYRVDAAHLALTGELDAAAVALRRAAELAPDDASILLSQASLARQAGDYDRALDILQRLVEEPDTGPRVSDSAHRIIGLIHNDMGVAAYMAGDARAAVRSFNAALQQDDSDPVVYINRGDAHRDRGSVELAMADYHTAKELATDGGGSATALQDLIALRLSVCHDMLGAVEFGRTNYAHAAVEFTAAIELAPAVADYYVHRGRACLELGDLDGVRDNLTTALALDPEHETGRMLFGRFFSKSS